MDIRKVELALNYNSLCSFFDSMCEEEIEYLTMEVPVLTLENMVVITNAATEFCYCLEDMDHTKKSSILEFYYDGGSTDIIGW